MADRMVAILSDKLIKTGQKKNDGEKNESHKKNVGWKGQLEVI